MHLQHDTILNVNVQKKNMQPIAYQSSTFMGVEMATLENSGNFSILVFYKQPKVLFWGLVKILTWNVAALRHPGRGAGATSPVGTLGRTPGRTAVGVPFILPALRMAKAILCPFNTLNNRLRCVFLRLGII